MWAHLQVSACACTKSGHPHHPPSCSFWALGRRQEDLLETRSFPYSCSHAPTWSGMPLLGIPPCEEGSFQRGTPRGSFEGERHVGVDRHRSGWRTADADTTLRVAIHSEPPSLTQGLSLPRTTDRCRASGLDAPQWRVQRKGACTRLAQSRSRNSSVCDVCEHTVTCTDRNHTWPSREAQSSQAAAGQNHSRGVVGDSIR